MNKRHGQVERRGLKSERKALVFYAGSPDLTVIDYGITWARLAHRDGVRIPRSFRRYL